MRMSHMAKITMRCPKCHRVAINMTEHMMEHELQEKVGEELLESYKRSNHSEVLRAEMGLRMRETMAETESILAAVAYKAHEENSDPEAAKRAFLEKIKKFE